MLALTAALVAPYFIDWTPYRADFEREASRILGRDVKVEGTATARLLPFPSVTFTDVVVSGVEPGETSMTVETFSMDAELAPFMRGDIHIFDMRLVRPSVMIDIAADGAMDWAVRPSVPVQASHISLEKLTVTEGRVVVRHATSGRVHSLTEVDAEISARALTGPWRMEGGLRLDGMRTAFSVSTGSVDENGRMRVRVQARPERYPFIVETDGNARIEDSRLRYAGQFRLNASAANDRLRVGDGGTIAIRGVETRQAGGPPAYRLTGAFDLDHEALDVEEFRFETGPLEDPYTADGAARFSLGAEPGFFIRADGAQIRFAEEAGDAAGAASLEERFVALREFMLDMPRPSIPGSVELALPAIVAGDTTIRNVHLVASPSDAGWTVASLAATLPGRATLEAQGDLSVGEVALGFSGSLLLAVGQPSGFAAWLSRDVDEAVRRLPSAGFSASVDLTEERQALRDLELVLGAAKFRGEIDSHTPRDQRPSMALRLEGDRLDVEGMAAFASLFISETGEARLADRDLEFDIVAGPVTAAGLTAEKLDTALRLKDGSLEIDRLSIGGLAGANVSATGTIRDLATTPAGSIDATIISADLAPLADTLAARFPESRLANEFARRAGLYPGLLEDASIQLVASAAAGGDSTTGLAASATGEAGGTSFTLTATARELRGAWTRTPLSIELEAANEEAAALYAAFGLPGLPLGFAGGAETQIGFDGELEDGGQTRFSFTGDGLSFTFDGQAAFKDAGLSANGTARLQADDLEPWLAAGGVSLPGYGLGLQARLAAQTDIDDGLLVLSGLEGEISGEPVRGDLNAQIRDGLPHLTGALSLRYLDLAAIAEMAVGAKALASDGSGWPAAPFAQAVSTPVTTDLELAIERLQAGSFAQAANARLAMRLSRDGVSFSDVSASAYGGRVAGLLDFRNDGGTGLISGQLRLEGADAQGLLGNAGVDGAIDLTAALTGSGKSVDGLMGSLSGSGTAMLRDVSITGVDPLAFPALLSAANAVGPEIDDAATAEFAPDLVRAGRFHVDGLDFAFAVANGAVRVPPVRLAAQDATLSAELRADLRTGTVGADAVLTYDPGVEALVGSEPSVRLSAAGPLDDIRVAVDTQALARFLTQRALELEQQRVEAMQAALLEGQRHRREVRYYAALADERRRAAEEARRAMEQAERLRREIRQQRDEASQRAAEDERRLQEEEAERQRLEEETRRDEEEAERARIAAEERAEADRLRQADERLRAEVEELLRAPLPPPADSEIADQQRLRSPPIVEVTPTPRPLPRSGTTLSIPDDLGSSPASTSENGFMRMLFGDN